MVRRVTVGWDGSTAAVGALEWAARHYPDTDRLDVVQVDGGRPHPGPQQDLEAVVDRIRQAHPSLDLQVAHEHGVVPGVLASRTERDELVVLGGREHEETRRAHTTSTAYKVVLEAEGPVAVVPQAFTGGRDVVVGIAGRHDDPCVVLTAAREAAARHQRLVAVHVPRPLLGIGLGALPGESVSQAHDLAELERMVDEVLAPVVERFPGLPITRHVRRGRAADVLLAEARAAALLVIGRDDAAPADRRPVTHGSMLLSHAPVVVVPPKSDPS